MSVQVPINGNPELPTGTNGAKALNTATRLTVYTNGNPTSSAKLTTVNSIAIANSGAVAKKVSIEFSNDAGVTYFLLWRGTIAADGALAADIPGLPLFLNPGGILAATAETADFLTVTASTLMLG
jgi:hypothetical protein